MCLVFTCELKSVLIMEGLIKGLVLGEDGKGHKWRVPMGGRIDFGSNQNGLKLEIHLPPYVIHEKTQTE